MSFSVRTFDVREGGRSYKISLRVSQEKSLEDTLFFLAERFRTSGIATEPFGPFEMVVRQVR